MKKTIIIATILTFASFVFSQSVEVKDSADHLLISINDEGDTGGSITFPNATSVDPTTNKLYNIDNNLYWNGTILESGGSPVWSLTGNKIYYNLDNVGIGVADPDNKLTILQNHADQQGLVVTQSGTGTGSAATFEVTDLTSSGHALNVYNSGAGFGMDLVIHGSGTGPGGRFTIDNTENTQPAVYVEHNGSGPGIQVAPNGTGLSIEALGTVKMNGFEMPVGQVDGHVLTTDGSGVGTWQAPQGSGGSDSDWNVVVNDMHSNVSGNVGIGEPNPSIKLHVVQMEDEGAGMFILGNTSTDKIALTAETNGNGNGAAFMAVAKGADGNAGYFLIEDSNNPQVGLYSRTYGTGAAIRARTDGIAGTGPGTGSAGWFSTMNALNTAPALRGYTIGEGSAGTFRINNGANNNSGLFAETNGGGPAFEAYTNGGGIAGKFIVDNPGSPNAPVLLAETNSDGGPAGEFQVLSAANDAPAIIAHTNGSGPTVFAQTHGTGHALQVGIANPSGNAASLMVETDADAPAGEFKSYHPTTNTPALRVETGSTGAIGEFHQTNPGNGSVGLFVTSNGGGASIEGKNDGSGRAAWFHQDNPANPNPAIVAETNSTGGPAGEFYSNNSNNNMPTILSRTSGKGNAGSFTIDNGSNSSAALYATTNGSGYAIEADGPVRMTGFHMPTSAVNGHVLTSDASGNGSWQPAVGGADGDWTVTGSDIYSTVSGNVGIGTTSPGAKLTVSSTTSDAYIRLENTAYSKTLNLYSGDSGSTTPYIDTGTASTPLRIQPNGGETHINALGGNVGIGTTSPSELIEIVGGVPSDNFGLSIKQNTFQSGYPSLFFKDHAGVNVASIYTHKNQAQLYFTLANGDWVFNRPGVEPVHMLIKENGNVGIGVSPPNEKLEVAGKIRANTGFNFNGTDGVTGTYNFYNDGTTLGQVQSITIDGGIITNVTVVTAP